MSPIRYQGRHRKPRLSRAGNLIRGGVLSSVVGTVAVAGTASASAAEESAETTAELPTLDTVLAHSTTRAAAATEAYSEARTQAEWQRAQEFAAAQALEAAAERRAEAEARAEAEREARAQEAREAAEAADRAEAAGAAATTATPAGSGAAVVEFVRAQLGDGYSLGSTGPDAWDCSSLLQAAYASVGVSLPRVASDQSTAGTPVSLDALQAGDILYWGGAGSAYHVAVYTGSGTFIGAQNPSTGVVERDLDWDTPAGAVRVL